jgi:transcriptional regulator with XRE-family HTH domain
MGLSLADVAERTGIDKAALSRLETAQNMNPTVSTLCRYANSLGKRWKWILEEEAEARSAGNGGTAGVREPDPLRANAMSTIDPKYSEFWRSLGEDAQIKQHFKTPLYETDEYFHWFSWGQGDAPFGITFQRPPFMIVNLCLNCRGKPRNSTKELFDALERDRSQIEKDFEQQFDEEFKAVFGGPPRLKWERRDDGKESWISVYRQGVSVYDDVPKLQATKRWAVRVLIALKRSLADKVKALIRRQRQGLPL